MLAKTKIVIAGIGGVGGYFGGLLAKKYTGDGNVETYFLARGAHLAEIRLHGLKVIQGNKEFIAKPYLATSDANVIGIADFIIICTKNYDLAEVVEQLKPCIGSETIILPLLNGVSATALIKSLVPASITLNGCAYIVSSIRAPGCIVNIGNTHKIYFGADHLQDKRFSVLEKLLTDAEIDANYAADICTVIWEKFIFLSCIATATTYFNVSIGKLLAEHKETLIKLIHEVSALAHQKGIKVAEKIAEKSIAHYEALPFEATSSMHRDFLNSNARTELEALTGYVVHESRKLNVETPLFTRAYQSLLQK